MAKKTTSSSRAVSPPAGRPLVIVESPAKAKTIRGFLGSDYQVEASVGHIRDLPASNKEIPADPKGLKARFGTMTGIDVDRGFEPLYVISSGKKLQVEKLQKLLAEASVLYLATDEDREGEAIAWHLKEVLKPTVPVHRLVFHEITKQAIGRSLEQPREIDLALVEAQETRRLVDRIFGYGLSPLLWKKIAPKLSAGRVQSVAVRMLVERERKRIEFRSGTWWDLEGTFAGSTDGSIRFQAKLATLGGRPLAKGADFDSADGRLKNENALLLDETAARALSDRLGRESFVVESRDDRPFTRKPGAPFTTSSLQQEASRRYSFAPKRTMTAAQRLYENGFITYMRTDSTFLAKEAVEAVRRAIVARYGADHLSPAPREFATKVANAQEAHEAIRPAGTEMPTPEELKDRISGDELKVYELIWKRTMACQMADARGQQSTLTLASTASTANANSAGPVATFTASGRTIEFPGFLRANVEGSDDPDAELADRETILPPLAAGADVGCQELTANSHSTQPPGRYTEATLIKALEEHGIGRPSTYAATIETILEREYALKRGTALVPTWLSFAVSQLLEEHLPQLVDYSFTQKMELDLDAISRGEGKRLDYLRKFYFGLREDGLKSVIDSLIAAVDPKAAGTIRVRDGIVVRIGKFRPYIEHEGKRLSLPDVAALAPDELTSEKVRELLAASQSAQEPLGICSTTGKPVFIKVGKYGPYAQRGTNDDPEKKPASLPKGMAPESVDLATALKLLELPRMVGIHSESSEPITAQFGPYGPYITCGIETRSLPDDLSPMDVTLPQALDLLAQPKTGGKRARGKAAAIRTLGNSPVTGTLIEVRDGKYGIYVTDGTTNATLPKPADPDAVTLQQALELLAARTALGPAKKKRSPSRKKP